MQENDYFENHPLYDESLNASEFDCHAIGWFRALQSTDKVVVIGCGYGRESVHIGRRADQVYGIDVSRKILDKAVKFTRDSGVQNFTPVLAEAFETEIPQDIDLVFSHVVFQHLTRDLAHNYIRVLAEKLSPGGAMVIQFCEDLLGGIDEDAALEVYEPNVSYNIRQVVEMAQPRLKLAGARSVMATETALWHWVHLIRDPNYRAAEPEPEPQSLAGRQCIALDLTAPYQSYAHPQTPTPQGGAAFSTGAVSWYFLAGVALALGGVTAGVTLEAVIHTPDEPLYLLAVDEAYAQVGERVAVRAGPGTQTVRLDLPAGAYALVVQAADSPRGAPVWLQRVALYLP
jgi:SAM-dependent methyltransferase